MNRLRRLGRLEFEQKDLKSARQFYKQLILTNNNQKLISTFEAEDDYEILKDDIIKEYYIKALVSTNSNGKLFEKLYPLFNQPDVVREALPEPIYKKDPLPFAQPQESREYLMKTDINRLRSKVSDSNDEPIKITLSEAWSWQKLLRTFGSRLFYGVLIMTGLSVLLEQQGMLRNVGSSDVEPVEGALVKFEDVQGVDEAKAELEEIVEFLKHPAKFMELGGKLPKGVLLYGPPGTGKTHLARAVAGEAEVPFFQMSGSEFDELYVGVGAKRVRELFAAAKKRAPCIVFIDELDAVGSKRSMKDQSYMRQTLNQLLVEMDGFEGSEGVILIAATNTPESLDKALTRPGRFDKLVTVPLPDVKGRKQILRVHMKGVTVADNVNPEIIARGTPGFSGADLANLINQAAIKASTEKLKAVTMENLEWAKDKIIMGAERKSAVITEENKRMTAYHEGGHTLVAMFTKGAMPLHKVTVIPRGNALGVTIMLPEADTVSTSYHELLAGIDVAMGGRVAEEMIYGKMNVSTGASNDLQQATRTARAMVVSYGMSEKIGLISWSEEEYSQASATMKQSIESEVKCILEDSYARVRVLLKSKEKELHKLATALINEETLDLQQVKVAIK